MIKACLKLINANLDPEVRKPNPEFGFANNLDLVETSYIVFLFFNLAVLTQYFAPPSLLLLLTPSTILFLLTDTRFSTAGSTLWSLA